MIRFTIILIFAVLLSSGCVSVTKELPSYTTYKLNLEQNHGEDKKILKSIKIFEPVALRSVNNTGINYLIDSQFESYALSKWTDTPSKMLQYLAVEYLNSGSNYRYITDSKLNLRTDYKLYSQIEAFHQVINKEGAVVKLEISVFLKNQSSKIHFKRFSYEKPARTKDAKGAVKGLNELSNRFVKDLNKWILKSI